MEATVVNNTTENTNVEVKTNFVTKIKENWKPIAVVAASVTVGLVAGYKMGYIKGLNTGKIEDVVDSISNAVENIPEESNLEVVNF